MLILYHVNFKKAYGTISKGLLLMLLLLKERSFHKVTEEDTNSDNEMEKTKIEVYVEYGNFDDNWNNILDN